MDIYLTALALGGVGLAGMAVSGMGRPGHAHTGSAHAGHGGHMHAGHSHAAHGHASANGANTHATQRTTEPGSNPLIALMSPRVLFSVALGLGTAGFLLRAILPEPILIATALALGVMFERFIVTPIWNFTFRFASNPAATLESAVMEEATAVTSFDKNGQGLIAIQVDGQMVQLLGTLQSGDREMNVRVPKGSRLRVEDVDAARNRCTVSLI
jgi:hypothetical protein